jgi:hypothetical protein
VLPEQQPAAVQQLLQHLHQLAEQLQQQCGARSLANIMSACGHLSMAQTVQLLLPVFLQDSKLQQANPQEVSNTLWAVAGLGMPVEEDQVLQLVQRMKQLLPQANSQDISNALWSVAALGVQLAGDDAQQLVQHFIQVRAEATPQAVSNILGACASMGVQLTACVVQQLVQYLIKVLPTANTQDIANSVEAVARMGHTLPADQLQQAVQRFRMQLPNAIPQHVSETLWACGRMHYTPLQLLSALEQQPQLLTALLAAAGPQSLANMAWACGELGRKGKLLPRVLLQQLVHLLQHSTICSYTMQNLCNSCWTAAVLDLQQCVSQVLQLVSACSELWAIAVDTDLRQLYQVHLWLLDSRLPAPGQGVSGVLSQQQLQQCKDSWEQQLQRETASAKASDLHRSVFAALQALPADTWQQPPVLEQRIADGALSIDIAATTRSGVQLAIEVDGPYHFVQPDDTLTGPTLFRNRALAARGYVLVSIPYWEWRKLGGAAQRQQYLLSKLQAATPSSSSSSSNSSSRHLSVVLSELSPHLLVVQGSWVSFGSFGRSLSTAGPLSK